jgi:gp35|nr:MAG TPA: Pyocin large subunit [Caudoviricetes sp.]
MENDVLPGILQEVQERFERDFGKSEIVRNAFATLKAKKATYKTANEFAIEIGDILSKALGASLSADKLPDGKMYYNIAQRLLTDVLGRNHELVSGYASDVQKNLNDKAKIGLKVQVPELNLDRIAGIVNRFSSEENFEDVSWLLGEPIVNFTQSIIDDSIQKNAEFHHRSGLQPEIVRKSYFHCCEWCQEVQGSYKYPRVPKDVYRRHQHCRCTVDYDPKSGKIQNVWTKKISNKSSDELENRKRINIDVRDNNRKADIQEYKTIVDVLGVKNAPISLAKFQDLKYNDVKGYKELKDRIKWTKAKFPTEKSLNGHFKDHGKEFGDITIEEYQKMASDLLSKQTSDKILGYQTEHRRVRYDVENNVYVLGNPKVHKINTMFKPDLGKEYYDGEFKKDMGD